MYNISGDALIFDLYYGGKAPLDADGNPLPAQSQTLPAVTEETPCFRNITMENVVCNGAARAALFNGIPEMPVQNIVVRNAAFKADTGFDLRYVDGLTLDNVKINAAAGTPVTETVDIKNLVIK